MRISPTLPKIAAAAVPYLLLLTVIALVMYSNPVYDRKLTVLATPVRGSVDLSATRDGIAQLQGEWSFYWKKFLYRNEADPSPAFAVLPGSWNGAGILEPFGYASYGLAVTGLDPDKTYAFRVGHTLSAFRIVVNGETVRMVGRPGVTADEERPAWDSVLARFKPLPDGSSEILLQISNHNDRFGGSNASLYLGEAGLMYKMEDSQKLTEGLVFSLLFIMGIFFLALFLFRRKDRSFLWFAAICLLVGLRTLCYDGFVLLNLFPQLPWTVFMKIGYLTFSLAMIAFVGFLGSIFPSLVKKSHFTAAASVFGTYSLIVAGAPTFISASLLLYVQLLALATVFYGLFTMIRACMLRLESSLWLLAGFSFAIISFVYDMLVSMWIISGLSLSHLGMSICLFCLALMVIERYSSSFRNARLMTGQLQVINDSLRRFVPGEFLSFLKKESISDVMPGDHVEAEMAVLSADIRAFTAMSEKMQPDEVFAFLNEYLQLVGPVVRANGGFIAKYEGDGFYALFPSGAEAAVVCAVQIQSALSGRNRKFPEKKPIIVGIGIDAGTLTLGTIGDESRMDGAFISHCVACAGRMEASTKLYRSRILINGNVFSGLSDPVAWFLRPVDRIEVGARQSFLFEVYNNDDETERDLKWKTQGDLEHAVYAWFSGQHDEAKFFLARVLELFPEDPVARHYAERLQI